MANQISNCLYCNNDISKNFNAKKFCSRSCSTKFYNAKFRTGKPSKYRVYHDYSYVYFCLCNKVYSNYRLRNKCKNSHDIKNISSSLTNEEKQAKSLNLFTRIFFRNCKICNVCFVSKGNSKYCKLCQTLSSNKRSYYRFQFNVYDYPELFDLALLNKVGFYGAGGKISQYNLQGLSRDHKLSIADAIKNNYPQYYITHPMNCDLIMHSKNNKKKQNSTISFIELVKLVDNYDGGQRGS